MDECHLGLGFGARGGKLLYDFVGVNIENVHKAMSIEEEVVLVERKRVDTLVGDDFASDFATGNEDKFTVFGS